MKIGFIGLGMMGRGMAANLQKAGYALVVNDLTRQAASHHLESGATWAPTPSPARFRSARRRSSASSPPSSRPIPNAPPSRC